MKNTHRATVSIAATPIAPSAGPGLRPRRLQPFFSFHYTIGSPSRSNDFEWLAPIMTLRPGCRPRRSARMLRAPAMAPGGAAALRAGPGIPAGRSSQGPGGPSRPERDSAAGSGGTSGLRGGTARASGGIDIESPAEARRRKGMEE
ncbi:hypothetical protein [Hydrogenispora ethanolica]|uniref:hypothetical protein n=1 Tax=Hydrogenispora ethanolica TaxID=1082276 RepID=UPI001045EFAB|nr:hypothetical protein [Hydrogenispora ethanolica]